MSERRSPTSDSKNFGVLDLLSGQRRVPDPAAGITAQNWGLLSCWSRLPSSILFRFSGCIFLKLSTFVLLPMSGWNRSLCVEKSSTYVAPWSLPLTARRPGYVATQAVPPSVFRRYRAFRRNTDLPFIGKF